MLRQLLFVALAASASATSYPLYDRCDPHGPAHWESDSGSFCGAEHQSPIDICGVKAADVKARTRTYTRTATYQGQTASQSYTDTLQDPRYMINTRNTASTNDAMKLKLAESVHISPPSGHTLKLYAGDISNLVGRQITKPSVRAEQAATSCRTSQTTQAADRACYERALTEHEDAEWKFAHANFHWGRNGQKGEGSEHYLEGQQYPLELHLVHHHKRYNSLDDALASGQDDAVLVVGQLFDVDDSQISGGVMSPAMVALSSAMSKATAGSDGNDVNMDIYGLIEQSEGFFAYPGSLTTPSCKPVVTWVVMKNIQKIPSSVLDLFHDKSLDAQGHKAPWGNFRPLMPMNGRTIYWNYGGSTNPASYGTTTSNGGATAIPDFWHCDLRGAREPEFPCPNEANNALEVQDLKTSLAQALEAERKAKADLKKMEDDHAHEEEEEGEVAGQNVPAIVLGVFFGIFFGAFVALFIYMQKQKEQ